MEKWRAEKEVRYDDTTEQNEAEVQGKGEEIGIPIGVPMCGICA